MKDFKCPECGKQTSPIVATCSHCGYPLKQKCPSISYVNAPIKHKKIVIIVTVLLIAILWGISSLQKPFNDSIMPYGVHWGDSFTEVQKLHKNISNVEIIESGNCVSRNNLNHAFFGLNSHDVETKLIYNFDHDDSLSSIVIQCALTSSSKISGFDVVTKIIKFYTQQCEAEPTNTSDFIWEWTTESEEIQLSYWSDDSIFVMLTAN